jgi:hypothetical protein
MLCYLNVNHRRKCKPSLNEKLLLNEELLLDGKVLLRAGADVIMMIPILGLITCLSGHIGLLVSRISPSALNY